VNDAIREGAQAAADIGAYCRQVEEHLARVNEGQIIRVVGPAFELVRGWALEGVPLSVVLRGIDMKAERHRAGRSTRPLRLEFCEADVGDVYEQWRRSVGLGRPGPEDQAPVSSGEKTKRPSLTKHLNRVIERLSRVAGRLDLAETFRGDLARVLDEIAAMAEAARGAKGEARVAIAARLSDLDATLVAAARLAVGPAGIERLRADAELDLAAYRSRLAPDTWARSIDLGIDRLVRNELNLPTLTLDV
jgi:hypothetical protein